MSDLKSCHREQSKEVQRTKEYWVEGRLKTKKKRELGGTGRRTSGEASDIRAGIQETVSRKEFGVP